jgi:predicted dienelactone hydrolase
MLLAAACATPSPFPYAEQTDPVAYAGARGGYEVGYQEVEVTYDDPVRGAPRTLRTAAWYPTTDDSGEEAAYFNGALAAPGAWLDASVATGSRNLVVFSHGNQGYAENTAFLCEHLASHGFFVASPDHADNTALDGGARDTQIYAQRPNDISAIIDWATSDAPFSDQVQGPVVAAGHSFGGYTMFALAGGAFDTSICTPENTSTFCSTMDATLAARFAAGFYDDRIAAFVPMAAGDASLFGADGLSAIGPVLQMTASLDQGDGSEADTIWSQVDHDDNLRVILLDGGHQSFVDLGASMEEVPLEAEEAQRIVNAYALSWAAHYTGDSGLDAILDGSAVVSESAEVRRPE